MRIGVGLGPFRVSVGGRLLPRRRYRRPSRSRATTTWQGASRAATWQPSGTATTPDGRVVVFRCGHNHRSSAAAAECMTRRRLQVQRGQGDYLVTRVVSTPQSRERERLQAAEREAQAAARFDRAVEQERRRVEAKQARRQKQAEKEQERQQKRAQAYQDRQQRQAEKEQARRQKRWEQTQTQAWQAAAAWRQHTAPPAPAAPPASQPIRHSAPGPARHSLSWPQWGLIWSSGGFAAAIVLTAIAGNHPKSPVAGAGASLLVLAVAAGVVSAAAAGWRAVKRRREYGRY
jgi:septal ring factor EnvC (AmiA/AmiB activator)